MNPKRRAEIEKEAFMLVAFAKCLNGVAVELQSQAITTPSLAEPNPTATVRNDCAGKPPHAVANVT